MSEFTFKGSMSEKTLKKFLSRAVTFQGLCAESDNANLLIDEDIRMLLRTGAKLVSRAALFAWTAKEATQVERHFEIAGCAAKRIHAADPEIILQGFVAEIIHKSYIDHIEVPLWVFEAFGRPAEQRCFRFEDMVEPKKGPHYWGAENVAYPDWSSLETMMWYYYCARRYIDIGFECIHIQEGDDESEYENVDRVLTMCRNYAKDHARRGLVFFHNFFSMTTGGNKIGNRLLFDIQGNGLVPNETVEEDGALKCRIGTPEDFWCTWFGRSVGGEHPLGFTADICPTMLEFDNYGQQGPLGVSNGPAFGTWGYDDITWFAVQPSWYRDEFLIYIDDYMKHHGLNTKGEQAYFPVYPMKRVISASPNDPVAIYHPGKDFNKSFLEDYCASPVEGVEVEETDDGTFRLTSKLFYRANCQSDACPAGFGQEDIIRKLFLGGDTPENLDTAR